MVGLARIGTRPGVQDSVDGLGLGLGLGLGARYSDGTNTGLRGPFPLRLRSGRRRHGHRPPGPFLLRLRSGRRRHEHRPRAPLPLRFRAGRLGRQRRPRAIHVGHGQPRGEAAGGVAERAVLTRRLHGRGPVSGLRGQIEQRQRNDTPVRGGEQARREDTLRRQRAADLDVAARVHAVTERLRLHAAVRGFDVAAGYEPEAIGRAELEEQQRVERVGRVRADVAARLDREERHDRAVAQRTLGGELFGDLGPHVFVDPRAARREARREALRLDRARMGDATFAPLQFGEARLLLAQAGLAASAHVVGLERRRRLEHREAPAGREEQRERQEPRPHRSLPCFSASERASVSDARYSDITSHDVVVDDAQVVVSVARS